jgi:protein ImuA
MAAVPLRWAGDVEAPAPAPALSNTCPRSTPAAGERPPWPASIASAVWRGSELGSPVTAVVGSGFAALDAELPGGGWPCHALTEVLQPQPSVAEWRLLAPAMRQMVTRGLDVVIVGPPKTPHLPGLRHVGLDERRLVWVHAESPAERLWATEQIVRANAAGSSQYGGVLAIAGDDHACKSSTLPHQSEYAFMDAMLPVLNPAGVQEILDLGVYGWEL